LKKQRIRYRKLIKALKGQIPSKPMSPQDILNSDDIKLLINVAGVEQDKCLIAVLWESGMRT
jgi:hypothetical protein